MDESQLVVLFGDSLLMDTVEASLENNGSVGMMRIHATVPNIGEWLKTLCPDLIILDLNAPDSSRIIPFLWDQPGIPLLCLDVTCSRAIVLSSQPYAARTAVELANLIEMQTAPANGNGHGPQGRNGRNGHGPQGRNGHSHQALQ
jgi:hypothetical protein